MNRVLRVIPSKDVCRCADVRPVDADNAASESGQDKVEKVGREQGASRELLNGAYSAPKSASSTVRKYERNGEA